MIDSRFSAFAFSRLGLDTAASLKLAEALQEEIEAEVGAVAREAVNGIVDRLNALGHNLELFEAGENWVDYRHHRRNEKGYQCKLRIAVHVTAAAGYPHVRTADDDSED